MSTIEPAKSSRASCKVCKHKIEIKSARLGIENEFNLNGEIVKSIKWYHIECGAKKFPKEFKNAELNTATITRSGRIELSKEDIDQILEIKSNLNSTGFDILGISKVDETSCKIFKPSSRPGPLYELNELRLALSKEPLKI